MSKRTNPGTWLTIAIFLAILGSTIAPAATIDVDGGPAGNDFISPGETWKFFKGTEPPSNPPNAWKAIDFDDSNWQTGPGGFGYGDSDDATILNDMRNNYVSVYIRKEFSASPLPADDVIKLEIDYDDGFIAYLNGREIARGNMPGGTAAYDTRAAGSHEAGSPETFVPGTAGELLNAGSNILAIEGHNTSLDSSDFSLTPALRSAANTIRTGETWIVETDTVTLKGRADAPGAVSVLVNGTYADFNAGDGTWSVEVLLIPGLNAITLEQLDANTNVVNSRSVEIMYVPPANHVAGELIGDMTWSGAYIIENTVVVPADTVLKIEPGTMVLMKDAAELVVYGRLLAEGTEAEAIHFTRYGDGTSWKRIMFVEAADSRLAHCIIEYADSQGEHQDYYVPGPRTYHEAVVALACHVDIENCIFRNLPDESASADGDAIAIISDDQDYPGDATANILGCEFLSIGQGVHTRYSYVLVEDCYFTGKRGDNDDVDLWGESTPAPLIRNNLFLNPEHDDMINPTRCSAVIVGNVIAGCDDHGIVLRDKCFPVLMNNLIIDCSSAGIAVENSCEALLVNNTIVNCGRGIRLFDLGRWGPPYSLNPGGGTATVINCIIWDCPQPVTLTDSSNTQIEDRGSHITVKYSDIEGGRNGISVSGSQSTVTWGQGNINADPQFVAANNGDCHLKSRAGRWDAAGESWVPDNVTSPCIDAGDPGSPVAFEPYPNGGIINMGTYGGTDEAGKSPSGLHAIYGGGTGEPDNPYLIYTDEHMNAIGLHEEDLNKHFEQKADIDLGSLGERDFNIIGRYPLSFSGVFDGNGHTISNFRYISMDVNNVALFDSVEGEQARIMDLGLIDPVVDVESIDPNVNGGHGNTAGSLVNYLLRGAFLSRCYVRGGSVSGDLLVGGLVSYVEESTIEHCYSTAEVFGKREIGGLVAYNDRGTITNCHTISNVTGDNYAGGLVGYNDSTIRDCYAMGDVTCDSTAGGLAGNNTGTIKSSYSTGNVTGVHEIGGLVGRSHGNLTNCYSTGSVSGELYVGGLVGMVNSPITIANCYSAGNVIGITEVGGLVGLSLGTFTNCYSTGSVSGERFVGGLVGILDETAIIMNCYSAGNVVGITETGGLVGGGHFMANVLDSFWNIEGSGQTTSFRGTGKTTAEMQTAGTFLVAGWDFFDEMENGADDIWWITEGQDYPRLWWELSD
ncbi:MAG TPA: GLUG motif-containing protein [Sedimentisphaerales bacterium]|nr:GLUG motif-containing protein [Sedimentisphaerales bacterium]